MRRWRTSRHVCSPRPCPEATASSGRAAAGGHCVGRVPSGPGGEQLIPGEPATSPGASVSRLRHVGPGVCTGLCASAVSAAAGKCVSLSEEAVPTQQGEPGLRVWGESPPHSQWPPLWQQLLQELGTGCEVACAVPSPGPFPLPQRQHCGEAVPRHCDIRCLVPGERGPRQGLASQLERTSGGTSPVRPAR